DSLALARRALGEFAARTRARVVYNGMDVERIARAAAAPLPAGVALGGGPTVGMVGHLDARKNPAVLVEAMAEVRAAVPGARALLVGAFRDPAYERSVRERARALGLADAVAVTGFLANPFPVVAQLDLLVHPALRDPFPLALLEGMALGRPIVASVVGDGSTDGTAALLAGLGDRRVRPDVRPHAGIAAARNAGLAAARAPYIAFHDSDDVALPGRLAVPLAFLGAHPEVDLVIQNGRMLPPEDEPGAEAPWIRPRVARALAARPIGVA